MGSKGHVCGLLVVDLDPFCLFFSSSFVDCHCDYDRIQSLDDFEKQKDLGTL